MYIISSTRVSCVHGTSNKIKYLLETSGVMKWMSNAENYGALAAIRSSLALIVQNACAAYSLSAKCVCLRFCARVCVCAFCARVCVRACVCVCVCARVCMCARVCTCVFTCECTLMHVCILCVYVYD